MEMSNLRAVPWFSMEEWKQVYDEIYSDDVKDQTKGLEHLLLWKARCPHSIPVGVQCTLDLLQICLRDQVLTENIANGQLPAYYEHELCLMYSVTLMRFMNHIASLAEQQMSLYVIANKLQIPDWLVNIRHDAAHGQNLPSLCVLREAANFCLKWMHEHYWQHEAEMTIDWVVDDKHSGGYSHLSEQLRNIFEMWQAVMLYSKAGLRTIKEINDPKLVEHLYKEKKKYSNEKLKQMKKLAQKKHILKNDELALAQLLLLKELKTCLQQKSKCMDRNRLIVDLLLSGEGFLASPEFLAVFNTKFDTWRLQNDSFPLYFLSLWEGMLNFLQQHKILPSLLHKLLEITNNDRETPHRRRMCALWIKEFALALLKVHRTLERMEMPENQKPCSAKTTLKTTKAKSKLNTEKHSFRDAMKLVEEDWPDSKQVISLTIQHIPNTFRHRDFVHKLVQSPNKWTPIFLPSLLDLVVPALPLEMKDNIINLVNIYVQDESTSEVICCDLNASELHSIEELSEKISSAENINSNVLQTSHWHQSEGNLEWSKCPLGVLPWQKGLLVLPTQLLNNNTWQPLRPPISKEKQTNTCQPTISRNTINWNFIMQKPPKRRKPFSSTNLNEKVELKNKMLL